MKSVFEKAMRTALELTRRRNVLEATRSIRSALSGPIAPEPPAAGTVICSAPTDTSTFFEGWDRLPVTTHPGGRFETRRFICSAGSREYMIYVPNWTAGSPAVPLLLMLHGCMQTPEDFALGTGMNRLAEEFGFIVAYPRQSIDANHSACWNWFELAHQARDAGEPLILAGMTRAIMAEWPINPDRVYVAGLSAGGAMAAVMGATYPELFGAVGIHSGLAYGSASDLVSAFAAMRGPFGDAAASRGNALNGHVRTIVFHGVADDMVHPSNADRIVASAGAGLKGARPQVRRGRSAGGRGYTCTLVHDTSGRIHVEHWMIEDLRHAWSGGDPKGSYTDPRGPDASREMVRFFFDGTAVP